MGGAEAAILEGARRARNAIKRDGARAYIDGAERASNPHGAGEWKHGEWDAGWVDAEIASEVMDAQVLRGR